MRIDADAFYDLVSQAVDGLPEWVARHMQNIVILTQPWPTAEQRRITGIGDSQTLLGLYQGVPLTKRGRGYHSVPPDSIILFQEPLQARARDRRTLVELIRRTVLHEIAHHFGFDEDHIRDLGY